MKKMLSLFTALTVLTLCSCGQSDDPTVSEVTETQEVTQAEEVTETESVEEETEIEEVTQLYEKQDISSPANVKNFDSDFSKYVSNTFISTNNNYLIESVDNVTYRAYFPVEEYGELEYKFYFSNTVDSTYNKKRTTYVCHAGESGGEYTIQSAYIGISEDVTSDSVTNLTPVTFDGNTEKTVSPDEKYWSDTVTFDVPEGNYLVWEWTLTGENIPAIAMAELTKTEADYNDEKGVQYCDQLPLPVLIGADREVEYRVTAMGDSITQGCQTESMAYEFWSARIAQGLGESYGFWNCGLGYSRASDAATDGDWLERVSNADVVILAFGTNDIISGEYGSTKGNTAEELDGYVRTILDKLKSEDCSVIVFNAPPEDYTEELENVRTEYNEILKDTCEEYGVFYFDFASYLSTEEEPSVALYGGHPDGEGGKIVAEAFFEQYSAFLPN